MGRPIDIYREGPRCIFYYPVASATMYLEPYWTSETNYYSGLYDPENQGFDFQLRLVGNVTGGNKWLQ